MPPKMLRNPRRACLSIRRSAGNRFCRPAEKDPQSRLVAVACEETCNGLRGLEQSGGDPNEVVFVPTNYFYVPPPGGGPATDREERQMVQFKFAAFGRLMLVAAYLPLVLAGCSGKPGEMTDDNRNAVGLGDGGNTDGTNPADAGTVRVFGLDLTHIESTDVYYHAGTGHPNLQFGEYLRSELDCSGSRCVNAFDVVDGTRQERKEPITIGEADDYDRYSTERPSSGRFAADTYFIDDWNPAGIDPETGNFTGYGFEQEAGMIGRYSWADASSTVYLSQDPPSGWPHSYRPFYRDDGIVFSAAFAAGELHDRRPSASAAWQGDMRGVDMRFGFLLRGKARLVYSAGANTIDVEISEVRQLEGSRGYRSYSGSDEFVWRNLPVNSDGSFYLQGHSNDRASESPHPTLGFVDGDFYGPNAAETAGVFERNFVAGAWLAER